MGVTRLLVFSKMSWLRCCVAKKGLGFRSFPLIGSHQVPRDRGSPGRNRKPPFGALVTLIINTIVLSIVIIMSTVVVLCIVPRLLPCCSDYYRDSLSVAGVPPDYRDVRGPGDGAGQLVVLLPHPIINNATPCLSSVVSANLETVQNR